MKEFVEKLIERLEEKIKVTSLEIIVTGTKDKPYFEIKYKKVGKEEYNTGYSSYDLNNVFSWKEECFEIVNQMAEEYNNTSTDISAEQQEEPKIITAEEAIDKLYYGLQNIFAILDTAKAQLSDVYEGCSNDIDLLACNQDSIEKNQAIDKVSQETETRIECIRSMSVEEMADKIMESGIDTVIDFCQDFSGECEHIPESECRKCLIRWLNSSKEQQKAIPTQHFKERFSRVI